MTCNEFNQLIKIAKRDNYLEFISFALWDKDDINDTNCIYSYHKSINSQNVIIGFNASAVTKLFGAFHCKHRGGRDSWLRDAVDGTCFSGAYMTDVFKIVNSKSKELKKELKSNPQLVKDAQDNLIKELQQLPGYPNLNIIVIGKDANDYLPDCLKLNAHKVVHYAKPGIGKKKFKDDFKKATVFP